MNLSGLNDILEKKFGPNWESLEIETLSLELGLFFDNETLAKFSVLKALKVDPEFFLNDAYRFLRFVEVSNGHVVDPEYLPWPNSMELAFSIFELNKIVKDFKITPAIKEVCFYLLKDEGVVEPIAPFTFLADKNFEKTGPVDPSFMTNKCKDIAQYVKTMYETGGF